MKTKYLIISFLFLVLFSIRGYGQEKSNLITLEDESMYSDILKQEVKYSICLPEDYHNSKSKYPVVYMLHGLGDNASSWLEYGRIDNFVRQRVSEGHIIPMIYVMPEGYRTYYVNDYYGKFMYQDMFIKELIPHIDKKYRTLADKAHRATIGYSMGGFGAFTLALNNQDVFGVTVPLSISIRTDEQYMTEESPWWDDQWGKLFGGIGETGDKRLTDYYRKNNPFDMLKKGKPATKIYISNGDDEGTLARSNEELHILMRDRNIPHEFRVRNGGHQFSYWYHSLFDGLNFISDAFEGKEYRGDEQANLMFSENLHLEVKSYENTDIQVYLPNGYNSSNRLYPVLYIDAKLTDDEKNRIAGIIDRMISSMEIAPMIVIFFDSDRIGQHIEKFADYCDSQYRIRKGWRFRAYLGYKEGGFTALKQITNKKFTCIATFDASVPAQSQVLSDFDKLDKKLFDNRWIFIDASDKGEFYKSNGMLHLLLKDKGVYHEYRVRQGKGETDYLYHGLGEALRFISDKIHK